MNTSDPQTWHYGLVARYWAEFLEGGDDIEFYRGFVLEAGEPVLDLGCGTGRVLLPLLRAGHDVDGCDVSADMLAYARQKAESEGFAPALHRQAMHELDLPRRYRTVLIPGSFGLGGDRTLDMETLRRVHGHLEPGGLLVFDHDAPYAEPRGWALWLPGGRDELPGPWPDRPTRRAANGDEIVMKTRVIDLDPLECVVGLGARVELWRDGALQKVEEYSLKSTIYMKPELELALQCAGFEDIRVFGAYRREPARPEDARLIYVARRP